MNRFNVTECEIEISANASQDECSEQRGIDENGRRGGVGCTDLLPATVQFVHFKCTQSRGEEVAASFDRINLSVATSKRLGKHHLY